MAYYMAYPWPTWPTVWLTLLAYLAYANGLCLAYMYNINLHLAYHMAYRLAYPLAYLAYQWPRP